MVIDIIEEKTKDSLLAEFINFIIEDGSKNLQSENVGSSQWEK
jgi:hypothetical protein